MKVVLRNVAPLPSCVNIGEQTGFLQTNLWARFGDDCFYIWAVWTDREYL